MGRRPVRTLWQRGMRATRVGMRPRRRLQVLPESSDPPKAGGRERDHRRPQTAEPQDPKAKAEQQDPSGRFVRGHAKLGGRRPSARGRPAKLRDREPAGQRGPSERFVPGHTKLDGRRPGSLNKGGRKPGPGRSPWPERRYCGQGSRSHDARATDCGGKALAHGDPGTPGQHRTRALLASPSALGPPSRDDRPVADGPDMAGVSPGLSAVPPVVGREAA